MSILSMFRPIVSNETIVLSGEEARVAICALRRGAAATNETDQVQAMRSQREQRLADRIAMRIGRDV